MRYSFIMLYPVKYYCIRYTEVDLVFAGYLPSLRSLDSIILLDISRAQEPVMMAAD